MRVTTLSTILILGFTMQSAAQDARTARALALFSASIECPVASRSYKEVEFEPPVTEQLTKRDGGSSITRLRIVGLKSVTFDASGNSGEVVEATVETDVNEFTYSASFSQFLPAEVEGNSLVLICKPEAGQCIRNTVTYDCDVCRQYEPPANIQRDIPKMSLTLCDVETANAAKMAADILSGN